MLTRWTGCSTAARSWGRRTVPSASLRTGLPSMTTTSPGMRPPPPRVQSMKHSRETPQELPRVQPGKPVAGIVAVGNAVGQVRNGAKPFLLVPAEHLHLDPGIRAAKHGPDGSGYEVRRLLPLASLHPRTRKPRKRSMIDAPGSFAITPPHHLASKTNSFLDKLVLKTP